MNFLQRLARYLIGFGIGLVLVWVFFGNRDKDSLWGWTPENRVKGMIGEAHIKMEPKVACLLGCQGFSNEQLLAFISSSDVNFEASEVKEKPRRYRLESNETPIQQADFRIESDTLVWLIDFGPQLTKCPCDNP